jgi:plasmid stability protein
MLRVCRSYHGRQIELEVEKREILRTGPAQKIWEGHQDCVGAKAACEGSRADAEPDGVATAVATTT